MEWLVDPATNAKWAYKLSKSGSNWGKWETYANGSYRTYLLAGQQAFAQVAAMSEADRKSVIATGSAKSSSLNTNTVTGATGGQAAQTTNPLDWLSSIGGFFSRLSDSNTWLRIGEFILGAGLIIVALSALMNGTSAGKAAKKIAVTGALL